MDIQYLLNPATGEVPLEPPAAEEKMVQPDCARERKPGTPPKQIHEGSVTTRAFGQERHRQQRSYPREFKIIVLHWWYNQRVPQGINESQPGTFRAPLMKEVASRYQVPITTLHNWRVNEGKIVASRKGQRKAPPNGHSLCLWPELEQALYQKYRKRREEGKAVRRGWM